MGESIVIVADDDMVCDDSIVIITEENPVILSEEIISTIIIETSEQGLPGAPGLDGFGVNQISISDISPSQNVTVDSLPLVSVITVEWNVTVRTVEPTIRTKILKVLATNSSTGPTHSISGSAGDLILFSVDVTNSGSFLELEIQNNESIDIDVRISRIPTFL